MISLNYFVDESSRLCFHIDAADSAVHTRGKLMDIEQLFAARVLDAPRQAALLRKHGFPGCVSERVQTALIELWAWVPDEAHEISTRYVEWDEEDRPRPRPQQAQNVVSIR